MKVLLVSAHSTISGANKSMCALAEILMRNEIDVSIALRKEGDIQKEIETRGLNYIIMKNYAWTVPLNRKYNKFIFVGKIIRNITFKHAVIKYLKKEKFDIVHNNSISCYLVAMCAQRIGIKTVWHFREFLEEDHMLTIPKWCRPKSIINKASCGIAISKSIQDKYRGIYNIPIELIYNGVDVDGFYSEREILQEDRITIAVIGRVCEGKNQIEVIDALKALDDETLSKVQLRIIGDKEKWSPYYSELQRHLDKRVFSKVQLDGIIFDIISEYRKIDVVVVPSKSEAFGRVAIEAMLSGCYVIGANTAGTDEILDDDVSTKYQLGNIEELSKVITDIIQHRDKYIEKASKGQQYAKDNFSSKRNAEKILKLYEALLE